MLRAGLIMLEQSQTVIPFQVRAQRGGACAAQGGGGESKETAHRASCHKAYARAIYQRHAARVQLLGMQQVWAALAGSCTYTCCGVRCMHVMRARLRVM